MVTRSRPATQASSHVKARILIIEAPYYQEIALALREGATAELAARGATYDCVSVVGALEIPQALGQAVQAGVIPGATYDGCIVLGCVIRGETSHYDIVVNNANHWLYELSIRHNIPVGNAILTVDTEAQAKARAEGGRTGKGGDAARACLGLIELSRKLQGQGA